MISSRAGLPSHEFAIATREQLWVDGLLREERLSHGVAIRDDRRINASDRRDDELVERCGSEIAALQQEMATIIRPRRSTKRRQRTPPAAGRVRLVVSARRVAGVVRAEVATTITIGRISLVARTADVLRNIDDVFVTPAPAPEMPIVWRNGSAAVLLHEAAGHAAEHGAPVVEWPAWLSVADEPDFAIDDCGLATIPSDLLREPPSAFRCATFRDVPLQRMTRLVARQHAAPFELPASRVEVHLVAGGSYDPLTDMVTIDIAASTAGAFTMRRTRAEVARSLAGATGDPVEYPGVICSREGQELAVGSFAPLLITT